MKKYVVLCLLFFAISIHLWYKDHHRIPTELSEQKELIVPIHVLRNTSFTYSKSFIGVVQAVHSVEVVPYLSGFLKEVLVETGSKVEQGQKLFLLDDRIQLANLNQAKEAVGQAYATRENAKILYERMNNTESKAISSTELEQAKTEFEAADAAYQKAVAAQNQAKTLYDYTIILAPISGWVGNITATVGEYLSPEGKSLATIIGFSPVRLTFSVPTSEYHSHDQFEKAVLKVILKGLPVQEFKEFKVLRDNQADISTDSVSFFIDVANPNRLFIPGAYIELRFVYSENGLLVQKNWISLVPDGAEAYVLTNGVIEKRSVQIEEAIGNQYWIKSGLKAGDHLIIVPVAIHQIGQSAQGVLE